MLNPVEDKYSSALFHSLIGSRCERLRSFRLPESVAKPLQFCQRQITVLIARYQARHPDHGKIEFLGKYLRGSCTTGAEMTGYPNHDPILGQIDSPVEQ